MAEKGYVGRIKNSGTQSVKAPHGGGGSHKGSQRISGEDLRSGKSEKKG